MTEYRKCAGAGAIGLFVSVVQHMSHKFKILAHEGRRSKAESVSAYGQQGIITYFQSLRSVSNARLANTIRFIDQSSHEGNAHARRAAAAGCSNRVSNGHVRSNKPDFLGKSVLEALLSRRKMDLSQIGQTPAAANLESGALYVWVAVELGKSSFEQQTLMRKAVQLLMEESPAEINVAVYGNEQEKSALAQLAIYVACGSTARPCLPEKPVKKIHEKQPLGKITLHGYSGADDFQLLHAKAEGNLLARELTVLPA